ncbi:glutathione transferase GST 23-like [Punica granatum]|uniref:glutathione transferase n=1 Tax=Punica granatum TaxID=22663 RepID=A0A218XNS5_PUNGR|nr:glutathione transferase GST 23-like [Punica granatum]OWM86329.1 hypothetical protein CDL15_Pgr020637 [Punica granatum]
METVKLYGAWPSPYSCRVIWALKLKGIPFEYIEEDLYNKSPQLLQYNPVYNKIPVLVHGGRPICESMVILEYLDEKWPQQPLLPTDPYERAEARFWVKFAEDKGLSIRMIYRTEGEKQEKARRDALEMLTILEEHGLNGKKKFFGGDNINIVDIAFGWIAHWMGVIEEITGVKLVEGNKFPLLKAWMHNFKEVSLINENLPNREKMVAFFRTRRSLILSAAWHPDFGFISRR